MEKVFMSLKGDENKFMSIYMAYQRQNVREPRYFVAIRQVAFKYIKNFNAYERLII